MKIIEKCVELKNGAALVSKCIKALLHKVLETLRSGQNKRVPKSCDFGTLLVRREGFEPPAFWSVARRSIQLS